MSEEKTQSNLFLKHLELPVFKQKINLVFCDNPHQAMIDLELLQEYADSFWEGNLNRAIIDLEGTNALACIMNDKLFIMLPFTATHGVIGHEVFHIATMILDKKGLGFSRESEEAYAHVIDWITNEVYKYRKKVKKSMNNGNT